MDEEKKRNTLNHIQIWNLCDFGISERQVEMLYKNCITLLELSELDADKLNKLVGRSVNSLYKKVFDAISYKNKVLHYIHSNGRCMKQFQIKNCLPEYSFKDELVNTLIREKNSTSI